MTMHQNGRRLKGQTPVDSSSGAAMTIGHAHHEIHQGDSYHVVDVQALDTSTLQWMITTPAGAKLAHLVVGVDATGEVAVLMLEGADRVGATALTPVNRQRNCVDPSTFAVHRGVSGGTTDGDSTIPLINHRSGATGPGGSTASAGGARGVNEHVLKPSTKYVLTVQTFAAAHVSIDLDWYEHSDEEA